MCLDAIAVVYSMTCVGAAETYISSHMLHMGLPMEAIGGVIGCEPASYTVCCIVFSKYLPQINNRLIIAFGIALMTVATPLLGPPPEFPSNYWIVIAAMLAVGVALASAFVPSIPHMLEVAPAYGFAVDDDLADALGSVGAGAFTLGEMLGPLVGGALLNGVNFQWMVIAVAAGGPVCLTGYIVFGRVKEGKHEVPMREVDATASRLLEE